MSDDGLPPFPFGDLPPLPEPTADDPTTSAGPSGGLPSWLALAGLPEPDFTPDPDPPMSAPSVPYWPGNSLEDDADVPPPMAEAKDDDTLTDFPRLKGDDFPELPPTDDQLAATERMAFDPNPPEDDLPLPPPFDPHLSELSPFDKAKSQLKPKPGSKAQPRPKPQPLPPDEMPTLTRTPPPSAPLDIQPASAIWRTRRVPTAPRLEENGTVAVYRITVRDEAARGYLNCKVTFPIPTGLKQVQASRKPQARKGNLHWNLGPLGPDDVIPLSVKLPVSLLGPDAATAPRAFEVSYQPLPGARLIGELASPPAVAVNEPFAIKMRVSNTGELPTGPVTVRVADRSYGGPPVVVKVNPINPGDFTTVAVELTSDRPGRHEWFATVESPGSEAAESTFSTEVVEAALSLELRHEAMMRLDDEEEIAVVVTNTSAVPARGVTAMLTMPEELTFASAPGGEFDRALNLIGWLLGDIPPGEARTVVARLRGFAPGLVAIQARADGLIGTPVVSTSNIFVEVDARSTSSSLDKLLAAMQDAIPDDDQPAEPRDRAADAGARHVLFALGGTQYAVRIENVREVLRPSKVTPVPGMPEWLPGVANVRGDIISLVDLPRYLNVEDGGAHRGLLVAQSDDGQLVIGLLVNEIVGIRRFPPARPVDEDLLTDGAIAEYLDGIVEYQNKLVPILDLNALFASAELSAFQAA